MLALFLLENFYKIIVYMGQKLINFWKSEFERQKSKGELKILSHVAVAEVQRAKFRHLYISRQHSAIIFQY